MKTIILLVFGMTSLFVLSSCNEDKIFSNSQHVKSISVTSQDFLDGDVGVDTRAVYTVDGSGFHFTWTQGDTVGIYPVGGDQVAFPISSGEGSQTAQFDGGAWALRSSYSYAAYYPFTARNYHFYETNIPVSYIGQSQNGNGSLEELERFDYQASIATKPDVDGNVNIQLNHLGCFVRFQLTMPSVDSYKSLTLKSSGKRFVTTGTFDLTNKTLAIKPSSTSESFSIGLVNTSTTEKDNVLTVYVLLAPGDYSESEFDITVTGASKTSYTAKVSGKNMLAGKSYSYSSTCNVVNNLPDPSQTEAVYGDITIHRAYADSTDVTSFDIKAQIDGLSTLGHDYTVYYYYSETEREPNELSGTRINATIKDGRNVFCSLNNMNMCSTYYFRVAVATFDGILYGPTNYYTVTDIVTKGDMIDIGVPGVLFASCNLGADSPEQVGNKYSWGSVIPSNNDFDNNYPYYNLGIWKNIGTDISGTQYDVVAEELGNGWHIPSVELIKRTLLLFCTSKTIKYQGVNGCLVMGDNGNSIFIPGEIWTSCCIDGGDAILLNGHGDRRTCLPVRPVYGELPYPKEYVDLGLSVKWATCNVGALYPNEQGSHFGWGETEPHYNGKYAEDTYWCDHNSLYFGEYDWGNYKYSFGSGSTVTKYNTDGNFGIVDSKTTLDLDDDVAHVKWGDNWRMPTKAEFDELINNCTWTIGGGGYKVTSNVPGYTNSFIILPSTDVPGEGGPYGLYWSSSLDTNDPTGAWELDFYYYNDKYSYIKMSSNYRNSGLSVRPVCPSITYNPPVVEAIASIELSRSVINMNLDDVPIQIKASPKDRYGDIISAVVNWLSSNNAVAEVSSDGTIHPKGVGACTITAYVGDVQSTCMVKVSSPVSDMEYVDLGLSVKWATFNVGATKPEDYGDYFAWGETESYYEAGYARENPQTHWKFGKYDGYSWSSYKYCNGSRSTLTKYCYYDSYGNNGFTDTNTTLLPEDDVAHVKWGGDWRMPTQAEFEELLSNCTWTWTTENGVKGYKVTSNKTGYTDHSIFLPAAGCRNDRALSTAGSNGEYWSSSLSTDGPYYASYLTFNSYRHYTSDFDRYDGLSVRPVCP